MCVCFINFFWLNWMDQCLFSTRLTTVCKYVTPDVLAANSSCRLRLPTCCLFNLYRQLVTQAQCCIVESQREFYGHVLSIPTSFFGGKASRGYRQYRSEPGK